MIGHNLEGDRVVAKEGLGVPSGTKGTIMAVYVNDNFGDMVYEIDFDYCEYYTLAYYEQFMIEGNENE